MKEVPLWNHNNHYHNFLLAHVPSDAITALDIGCGVGEFARRLATVCKTVDAIDVDHQAITTGRSISSSYANLTFHCASFEGYSFPPAYYDFVSIIATLHHMNLVPTLERMKYLLKPNGILAILGLYQEETVTDLLWSMIAAPINGIYQYTKQRAIGSPSYQVIIQPPNVGLQVIRDKMNTVLPNHHFKRHLFWRYSIIWQK